MSYILGCGGYALAFLFLGTEAAHAANNIPIGNVLCTVADWFGGNLGKGLEAILITALGIGALMGKISWGTAIIEGVGGAIIFGAAQIVNAMGANSPLGCVIV